MKKAALILAALAPGAAALVGCGSGNGGATTSGAPPIVLTVSYVPKVGRVVTDSAHVPLFRFSKDPEAGEPRCYGACARAWHPKLSTVKPRTQGEAGYALTGTVRRKDGTIQATYAGWPLYAYAGGDADNLKGAFKRTFGGVFYPVDANGTTVYTEER